MDIILLNESDEIKENRKLIKLDIKWNEIFAQLSSGTTFELSNNFVSVPFKSAFRAPAKGFDAFVFLFFLLTNGRTIPTSTYYLNYY